MQYGENDFAFLSRLWEEPGIAFTFPEDEGGKTIALGDKLQEGPVRGGSAIPSVDNPSKASEKEFVTRVRIAHEVRPGAHTIRDYDFRRPSFPLFGEGPAAAAPEARYEQYQYQPHGFLVEPAKGGDTPVADDKGIARHEQKAGKDRAARALVAERTGTVQVAFETNVVDLWPGQRFSIDHHPHAELDSSKKLLVTELSLEATPGEEWHMAGNAVFSEVPYRPPFRTTKPMINSVQTATVVDPSGQEIYTDEFGRVRVQFPWDREGLEDEHSSCWIRVNQGWGGQGWGMMLIPRIGQEVLVGLLEGDPDRPILVGRLFNQTNPVPYRLPDHKTVSTWKSHSAGGDDGYNEIKYEDKAGEELLFLRAEKNLRQLVKNDETITVVNDRDKHVVISETDTTGVNRTEVTGKDRTEMTWTHRMTYIVGSRAKLIRKNETERTDGTRLLKVGRDLHSIVKGKKRELVQEDFHLHAKGKRSERIDGTQSLTLLIDQLEDVEGSSALSTGQAMHFASLDKLIGEASDVTLTGPGGFIRIDGGGVTIHGMLVQINVGGSSGKGKGSKPELPELPDEAKITTPPQPGAKPEQEFANDIHDKDINSLITSLSPKPPKDLEAPPFSHHYDKTPTAAQLAADPRVPTRPLRRRADSAHDGPRWLLHPRSRAARERRLHRPVDRVPVVNGGVREGPGRCPVRDRGDGWQSLRLRALGNTL